MKNILPFLLCVVVASAFGQSKTDAALKDQINSTIRAVTTSNGVTRAALSDDFDDLIDSKVNIIQGVTALGTNTYSVTISSGVTSYTDGLELTVKIANANTGTATLNVNAIGAKDIVDVASGDLEAGKYYKFVYNGTAFQLVGGLGGSDIADITGLQDSLTAKQNVLVSGANIKTLESVSLLGSGNIDLAKGDVGLGNVDNTSDANKPVSTAQQTALDLKLNSTISYKTESDSHTLDGDDLTDLAAGKKVYFFLTKSSASTVTLSQDSDLAIPVGASFIVIRTHASGLVTFAAGTGATASGTAGVLTDAGLNVAMEVTKTAANTWLVQNGTPGAWIDYVPAFTGFSVNPTIEKARYVVIGKICFVRVSTSINGTSNANTFTITLPFNAALGTQHLSWSFGNDNGVLANEGRITLFAGSNVAGVFKTHDNVTLWTTSGSKTVAFNIFYEIQ